MVLFVILEFIVVKFCVRARKVGSVSCFCCFVSCDCVVVTLSLLLKIERYFFSVDILVLLTGMFLICSY